MELNIPFPKFPFLYSIMTILIIEGNKFCPMNFPFLFYTIKKEITFRSLKQHASVWNEYLKQRH